MSLKKYIRKNIYRWHRITSLIVALPILLWSLSGFLHPVINSFKPDVRNQSLPASIIDTSKIQVHLQQALEQNKIASLHNFRIVKLDSIYYYQIQQLNNDTLTYLSVVDGKMLKNGDQLYAAYLAQRYLSEPVKKEKQNSSHGDMANADISFVATNTNPAKRYIKSKIASVELIKEFNSEYKSSNVLLPVYRVNFERKDGIRLYIETSTDRLATAVDTKRSRYIKFFGVAHSWNFLDGLGPVKQVTLGIFSLLCFLTSLLGFYVYNIINKKKTTSTGRSWHRTLGNVFVVTTALYGLSGAWHAFHKLFDNSEINQEMSVNRTVFTSQELKLSIPVLLKSLHHAGMVSNISVVKMYDENYWQLILLSGKDKYKKYIHVKTGKELMHGDVAYGRYLTCLYSGNSPDAVTHSASLTKFTNGYSMKYKRLPVMEVSFAHSDNYYVETSTGRLSAITNSYDKAERFSFSNLHMHHYWEHWFGDGGKTIQKSVLVTTTLGLLLLALTGCLMYWKKQHRTRKTGGH